MNTQTTPPPINVCPAFWKDIKQLQKKHKDKSLKFGFDEEILSGLSDEEKLKNIPYIGAIVNTIQNSFIENKLDSNSDKYDRQPFIQSGWEIRKMRYAIDNRGQSNGTRTIFCVNSRIILIVCIKLKSDCANERNFEGEFMPRIKEYLGL